MCYKNARLSSQGLGFNQLNTLALTLTVTFTVTLTLDLTLTLTVGVRASPLIAKMKLYTLYYFAETR